MTTKLLAGAAASLAILAAGPALAHHSGAMFDRAKDVTLSGVVKDWMWTNPHTWLVLVVTSDKGDATEWNLEGQSPQVFRGRGWMRTIMKPGDKVTVHLHPLRDGAPGGSIAGIVTADGRTYN